MKIDFVNGEKAKVTKDFDTKRPRKEEIIELDCPQCGEPMKIRYLGPRAAVGACKHCDLRMMA